MPRIPPENVRRTGSTEPPENVGPIVEVPEEEEEEEEGSQPFVPVRIISYCIPVKRAAAHDTFPAMLTGPRFTMPEAGIIKRLQFQRCLAAPLAPGTYDNTVIFGRIRTEAGGLSLEEIDISHGGGMTYLTDLGLPIAGGEWFGLEFWVLSAREEGNANPMDDLISVTVSYEPPS